MLAQKEDLREELRDYPAPRPTGTVEDHDPIAIPFRLATIDGVLSFFSTATMPIRTLSALSSSAFADLGLRGCARVSLVLKADIRPGYTVIHPNRDKAASHTRSAGV